MTEIFPLFSVPLYKSQLEIDLTSIKKELEFLEYFEFSSGNGHCTVEKNILNLPIFNEIKTNIQENIHHFLFDILKMEKCEYYFSNSWINLHKPKNYSQKHLHQNSFYSGIYYLNVPEGDCGNITFHHPQEISTYKTCTLSPKIVEYNVFNSKEWFFSPQENTLLLFPSHLSHSVSKNNTSQDRHCLAFNIFLRGSFGNCTNFLNL